jgi:photosystem II stability/assembly factor-like uncharacterized protein
MKHILHHVPTLLCSLLIAFSSFSQTTDCKPYVTYGKNTFCEGDTTSLRLGTNPSLNSEYRWFRDNNAVAGATGQSLIVSQAGTYRLETTRREEKWAWAMDGGPDSDLNDIQFLGNTGWIVGNYGTLLRTTNGSSWDTIPTNRQDHLTAVSFVNTQIGWIGGANGLLLKSTNGGTSWEKLSIPVSGAIQKIKFLDEDKGYILADRLLFKTINGGASWLSVTLPNSFGLEDIAFVDENYGWIASNTQIYKTENGGGNWTLQKTVLMCSGYRVQKLYALDKSSCLAFYSTCAGVSSYVSWVTRTTNGGASWSDHGIYIESNFPTYSYLTPEDVVFTDEQTGYAIGRMYKRQYASGPGTNSSAIFKTTDGGKVWKQIYENPFDLYPKAIAFRNTTIGVMVGAGGAIMNVYSSNTVSSRYPGRTFLSLTSVGVFPNALLAVGGRARRADNNAHPDSKAVTLSSVDGKSWSRSESGSGFNGGGYTLRQARFKNDRFGWRVGFGMLYTTNDGGSSWQSLLGNTQPPIYIIDKAYFQTQTSGWYLVRDPAYGGASLYKFSGASQTSVSISYIDTPDLSTGMLDLHFINDDVGFITTSNGKLIKTTNGGANWSVQVVRAGKRLQRCFFVNDRIGWVITNDGTILKTQDGGQSWAEQNSGVTVSLNGIHFLSEQVGYVAGVGGLVLKTSDGGNSWVRQNTGTRNTLNDITFADPTTGWAVGDNGTILKLTVSECRSLSDPVVITVNPKPEARLTTSGPTALCEGASLTLNAPSGSGYSYQWLKDDQVQGNVTSSSLTVTSSGNYKVQITNMAGCQSTSNAMNVQVRPLPSASLTLEGNNPFCAGTSVRLVTANAPGYSYQWRRDTTTIQTGGAVLNVSQAGSYTVVVGNEYGCYRSSPIINLNMSPQPEATITTNGTAEFCEGGSVDMTANAGSNYTYQWYRNGAAHATASQIKATQSGDYTVRVKNPEGCERTSEAKRVVVNALPVLTLVRPSETTLCQGKMLEIRVQSNTTVSRYEWYRNGQPIMNANAANLVVSESGTYEVRAFSGSGCPGQSDKVVINPPYQVSLFAQGDTVFCAGQNVSLRIQTNSNSLTGYQWFRNGTAIAGATINGYVATESGSYAVETVDALGCKALSEQVRVRAKPLPAKPIISASGDMKLVSSASAGNQWFLNGTAISGATGAELLPTQAGRYTVRVSQDGCSSALSESFEYVITALDPALAASVALYPNPSPGHLFVSLTNISGPVELELFNSEGRLLAMRRVTSPSRESVIPLELKGLAPGTYIVRVRSGTFTKSSKVILNH